MKRSFSTMSTVQRFETKPNVNIYSEIRNAPRTTKVLSNNFKNSNNENNSPQKKTKKQKNLVHRLPNEVDSKYSNTSYKKATSSKETYHTSQCPPSKIRTDIFTEWLQNCSNATILKTLIALIFEKDAVQVHDILRLWLQKNIELQALTDSLICTIFHLLLAPIQLSYGVDDLQVFGNIPLDLINDKHNNNFANTKQRSIIHSLTKVAKEKFSIPIRILNPFAMVLLEELIHRGIIRQQSHVITFDETSQLLTPRQINDNNKPRLIHRLYMERVHSSLQRKQTNLNSKKEKQSISLQNSASVTNDDGDNDGDLKEFLKTTQRRLLNHFLLQFFRVLDTLQFKVGQKERIWRQIGLVWARLRTLLTSILNKNDREWLLQLFQLHFHKKYYYHTYPNFFSHCLPLLKILRCPTNYTPSFEVNNITKISSSSAPGFHQLPQTAVKNSVDENNVQKTKWHPCCFICRQICQSYLKQSGTSPIQCFQ